ncbi:ph-response sensor protein [Cladophialophora chaetospira]|uniref:Ph-response sensor protein n=1 Tax=Cladophialophora chaetospira TaxID=386627 RepID=A0AA38X3N6_9EURO|nr:ph-response sensor protein [Cladophialophora chaetospira]
MFEIAIEPEDPFRTYSPGQKVKGHISLTVLKGFDITHLVVALHGYAKVYKHQIPSGEGVPEPEGLTNGQGSRGVQYHGNGLASLFQHEQVLCGSGFLKKQVYKFAFEVSFPAKGLPSTIDFERGTISYMLTATVTRPTTIGPVTSRSAKIKFQDLIDIEPMSSPKSRVITLEPVSKRGKVKVVKPSSSVTTQTTSSASAGRLTRNNTQNSTASRSANSVANPPLSPAPSEETVHTNGTTTSSPSFQIVDNDLPVRKASPHNSDSPSNTTSSSANTITATTELPRHGALPGDMVPIRVSVSHTKTDARGMVIATLFRLARIDMHPPLPLPNRAGKGKKMEYEDVYPKSRTGLGGLYFSAASPNSAFRKDLAQSSTMLIVNPNTMTADITTSLKIPDASFPTISNVPGGMISFTYHIEVVVDLFGKLGETRFWPRLTSGEPTFSQSSDAGNQISSDWSNQILDTSALRRTKSVITFEMSLVVGTQDSGRKRKQVKPVEYQPSEDATLGPEYSWHDSHYRDGGYDGQYYEDTGYPYYDNHGYDHGFDQNYYYSDHPTPAPEMVPPPEPEDEVDEKTRLRRQEQLLLPSEPPQEGESSHSAVPYTPTAPDLTPDALADGVEPQTDGSTTPSTLNPAASVASSTRSGDTIRPQSTSSPTPPPFSGAGYTEDKQELERRRLMTQASAPPVDDGLEASDGAAATPTAPTAPTINEHHEYSVQTLNHDHAGSDLPQYER